MYPVTPARRKRALLFPTTAKAGIKLLIACLVFAAVPLALYLRVDSKNLKPSVKFGSKDSKLGVTVHAAGRGGRYLNLQDGHQMLVNFSGNQDLIKALQSGQARPRSLASIDLNGDVAPDLLTGYAYGGVGILTVQPGNTDAFAPKDESVYLRMHEGYNPDSLLSTAETYQIPAAADFLQVGDFNNDQRKDVLVGAQHGDLFFLAGDGQGNLATPVQIPLAGVVTALAAGEFRLPDGRTDVAVGIDGPSGPQVLIYDGADGVTSQPMQLALDSPATALEFGEVDANPFMGLSIATGNQIEIVHGWGRKHSPTLESRVERIDTGMNVRGLASGFFMWSRDGNKQLAALSDDGTIRIFGRGQLNTQPLTDEEKMARGLLRLQQKRTAPVDLEMLTGWQAGRAESWTKAQELVTGNIVGADASAQNLLLGTHISFTSTDDLMVLGSSSKLEIVRQVDTAKSAPASANLVGENFTATSLDSAAAPATVLALPQKLNGQRDLLVLQSGDVTPSVVVILPAATLTVDRTDDPAITTAGVGAAACTAAVNDCSLRGAVQFANANPGTVINLGSATYTLNTNGNRGCVFEGATGNTIGDLEITPTTTFTGVSAAATIINQVGTGSASFPGDRVLCMDVDLSTGHTYTFSAMTIAGGRDLSGLGGGGFLGGAVGTSLSLTDVTFANNQTSPSVPQGPVAGGAVGVTGGDMTVANCTFGAANNPGASRTSTTLGNAANTLSGGGISYSAGDPKGVNGAAATLTITGTTFTHNTASSVSTGGGGLDVFEFNVSATTASISTSAFTSNQATGTASGGGIINEGINSLTIATTSFTSNSAGNRGGGLYVGGGNGTFLNGTTPSITFSGNTATTAGSSISAAGAVTLSGTNTTIGGDLEITTNGIWTNSAGSAMSPTNFIMTGTANFIGNNSTTNVGGNFNFGSGTFTAGTSTFNFNGSAPAQSITNASSITFFNLTDSNTTNPLTLNNSFAVGGSLNISGANAILAPVAAAIISGGGSLTGTGTARVTRTGADSFFTQYAMTGGRTLTNLTVEYIGAAAQTASTATYNNLKINNGSGVTLNAGTTIVNGTLTLQTGALNVAANTLTINNGTSVVGGSLTSGATGTVNYNQSSAGQSVIAGTYGNLNFSAFTKVLASSGTIGVAGTFNPNGVTSGHTIAGSTFDFNGAGAQTVPVFNYNNLTISGARTVNTNVTLPNAGTIGIAGTFSPTATFLGTGKFDVTNNTIDFNGAGAQTIAAFNYNNLTISGNRAVAITLGTGNVGVAGTFNPSVTSNTWTANPANTMIFNGAAAQTIPAFAFYNGLTLSNAAGATLGGNVTVLNGLSLNAGALGVGANTLTLNGAVSLGAGSLTSSPTGTVIYNQQSNGQATVLAANYGNLTFSNFSKTLASSGTIGISGTFTPGTGTGHTISGSTINFNAAGAQTIPGFTYNNLTSTGAVARTLDSVNTIKIAGIFTPGASTYTITGSTVEYNGAAAQTLPSSFTTYNNLTLNNPTTVAGFAGLTVQGLLRVQAGTFTSSSTYNNVQVDNTGTLAGTAATTINVSGNWTINTGGAFTPNGNTVNFNGSGAQTIGGTASAAGATTFNNLTIANAGVGVTLGQNETVNGVLTLTNDLNTSTFTLTMPAAASSTGNSDVIGTVKRTNFVTGACANPPCANTLSFGNPNNQITVTAGTAPTDIAVKLVKLAPATFSSSVTRTYTITPNGGTPTATLRLRYLDTELNGNIESQLDLWRFNGSAFVDQQQTARDAINNWVEKSGVTTFSDWTIATHVNQAPSVTSATTVVGAQTTSGLVIDRQPADAGSVTHFKITSITNGTLFKNNGTTPINNNDFITYAEGNAGLKFTPTANSTATGSFNVQASSDASGTGLSPTTAATITVNKGDTTTTITSDSPDPSGVGQVVTVNFTVVPNLPSTGAPSGNVVITVNDASGDTCTGTVAVGTCNLTLTTTGSKILTATYVGDSNFLGTVPDTETHDVNVGANAVDDNYGAFKNKTLNIAAPGVLANDTGSPTATPIAAGATTAGGTVTLNADGSFSYTPPTAVFTGADSFTYTATNGIGSDTATVNITVSDTVYINEILFNPPGTDAPNEYIELRGAASSTIPSGTYMVAIEGDSADNPGDVQTIINLSGLTFGSNGFLVLLQNANTYTTVAGATVLTSTTTGFGGLPGGIWSADGGATDIEDASVTFMVIQTGTTPALTNDIDTDDNGTPDGATFTGWSVIDSIGALDGTATTDFAYGAINYSNNTGTPGTAPGTPVLVAFTPSYLGRSGDTTGSAAADWVASGALGGAQPNWTLSATETEPIAFANQPLNHIGTTNFDVSPPTVQSITRVTASPTNATSVDFLVSFSEPVTGVDSSDFSLTTTGVSGPSIGTVTGSGATRTVTVNTGTLSGTIRLDLTDNDSIKDGSNNALGGVGAGNGSFTTGEVYTIDKLAPTVDITDVTPDPRATSVSTISIVFSEAITGFDLTDLSLTRDGGANLLTGSQTLTTSDNITWTLGNLGSLTGADGNYALTLTSGGISDNAGNALSGGASDTWVVNAAAPTVDITDVTPDPRNTSVSSIAIVFSEAVSGFDIGDLTLTRNGGANLLSGSQTLTSGDNITWTLGNLSALTGTDGSYTLTLTAPGGITDGGGASLASGATDSWSMDATGPTVTINQASGQADPTSGSPINFTVVFNEAVTNFVTGDVAFSGAGATTATVTETAPNNGTTYNVAVTGMSTSGTVTASLVAGVASDALGNLSQASSSIDNSVTFNLVTNNAPVLDNTGDMALTTISEDVANASNPGTLVTNIIASAGGDRITDVDPGAVEGIAVSAVDNTNGTWQFSIDNGSNWSAFGTPNTLNSRLLASNATTLIRFVPNGDFNGTVDPGITFRAWDQTSGTNGGTADTTTVGGSTAFSTATETASIIITEVNDAPTATGEALTDVAEDSSQRTIPFADLTANDSKGAANESGQTLIVNAVSNPVGGTVSTSAGNVLFTPALNFNGAASFQYTVQDNGTTNGGADFKTSNTATATFTITAVNDVPVNTVPGAQGVTENSSLTFSAGNSNAISIADLDAGSNPVQVQLTATNGVITLSGTSGLSFTIGDGTADAAMTFTGTIANINTALNGMVFTPTANFNGAASLQIISNDQGNTGSGGALSDTDTVAITVNDGGALQFSSPTYVVSEGTANATITITRTGGSTGTATVVFSTSDGTATAGQDYTAVTNQTVTFNNGDTSKTVDIPITDDLLDENNETVNLTLSSPGGSGVLGAQTSAVLTINDDDGAPALSINDVSLTEGNSGTKTFTFTVTLSPASALPVTVNYATANGTADSSDYTAVPSTLLTFNPGDLSKTVDVIVNGDIFAEADETFFVNLTSPTNATIADNQGKGTIQNDDAAGGVLVLSSATYSVAENAGSATITVNRTGTLTQAVSIDYATSDGTATERRDYTSAFGTLKFAAGESSKTFTVLINQDAFAEPTETVALTLSNATGGSALGVLTTATLQIADVPWVGPPANPIDDASFFVRQHYHDFLNREPDAAGLAFWINEITSCGSDAACTEVKRINVSAAFFLSIEFQETGGTAYLTNKVSFNSLPSYANFERDTQALQRGFVFGASGSAAVLEANKVAYFDGFVTRPTFVGLYGLLSNTNYVDALIANTGVTFTSAERTDLINGLNNATETRATILRKITEKQSFKQAEFTRSFVLMEYFGYLRRDPDMPGFNFWLAKLNQFNGNFLSAEMVKAFISSIEYRQRFAN